jgi:cyclic beta-1,2-glucan synthetase
MQVKYTTVQELLPRLRSSLYKSDPNKKFFHEEPPLRSELFNTQQMEQHAKSLAASHKLQERKRAPDELLKRLADNEKVLLEVRNLLVTSVKEKKQIPPGGEWLLDNFYLIEDQVRTGKRHLPKGYSESLPSLLNGPSAGLPRVYDIVVEIIANSDGRIDMDNLATFVRSYQSVSYLKLGELWAIPIMLRLALIENLRRVAVRIASDRMYRDQADNWARQMIETAERDPKSLILVIADMARSNPPIESSFVAELTRQLMWKGPALALPLTWMEQRLSENGQTSVELVNRENQEQAADQLSISNSIESLRFLSGIQWQEFVESMSVVEKTLYRDINDVYGKMDFSTRDHYRHVVERIARRSSSTEKEVAEIAIKLAAESAKKNGTDHRTAHVGYYLIDKGVTETEKSAKFIHTTADTIRKAVGRHSFAWYTGSVVIISLLLTAVIFTRPFITTKDGVTMLLALLFALAASQFAIAIVNWFATLVVKPDLLPRMDFSDRIPEECKTLVAVPSMLSSTDHVEALVEGLEVRYLGNRKDNFYFALLTDFMDAKKEKMPGDEELVALAKQKIEVLNEKYQKDIFFLFHRPRLLNKFDNLWMGYERKRGKLAQLNTLLKTGAADNFSHIAGNLEVLEGVRYVITLDSDTQLPLETGWKMVGTMAHPLNRPVFSKEKGLIVDGYGILQPRASITIPSFNVTVYQKIHVYDTGIDPYTRATSDVYQDVFHEGSFIGKGIYEVDAFERTLGEKFPENRILSHDLLEGCHARAGLLSDVQLYEEFPSHYGDELNRRHRWIRGDWQIGRWLLPYVRDSKGKKVKNHLSALAKWKIFDNLRRSLVPPALVLLLVAGWISGNAWFWTTAVIVMTVLPTLIAGVWSMLRRPEEASWSMHLGTVWHSTVDFLKQGLFSLICLPHEAYSNCDAICRTIWRMFISHRKLLEWKSSDHNKGTNDTTLSKAYISMWINPLLALAAFVVLSVYTPVSLFASVPVLISWIVAPAVAWRTGKPVKTEDARLSESQEIFLRKLSRMTWRYFETFVTAEENWLPPDNFQEQPAPVIAHRTSPTNIGLSLLSSLGAYDFGYITMGALVTRLGNTMDSMVRMERYRGHLYNWYDTVTLEPLFPKYISSVDSGNLAGMLLTLRQGLQELPGKKVLDIQLFSGLRDILYIIPSNTDKTLKLVIDELDTIISAKSISPEAAMRLLKKLQALPGQLISNVGDRPDSEVVWWAHAFEEQCNDALEELYYTMPWLALPAKPARLNKVTLPPGTPSLNELADLDYKLYVSQAGITDLTEDEAWWLKEFQEAFVKAVRRANERMETLAVLSAQCAEFADIDYEFLYDKSKQLLSIGYSVENQRMDPGFYDLLASESRLSAFVAIAQGKLPQASWFAFGRSLSSIGGTSVLLSWSGSMFEYLMPQLVMPAFENSLVGQTNKAMVQKQIEYGRQQNVPWGISESGYNMRDANLNYQYRAFGVPGLGLKRGLADDLVIAPYASALSLMVTPAEACRNLELMASQGFEGSYGLYEAIDYTPERLPHGQSNVVVRSFMAHHQGMSFLSFAYLLLDKPMQKRFEAELQFRTAILLLQERIPNISVTYSHTAEAGEINIVPPNTQMRVINTPFTPIPEIQLLSNGRYNVMVTNAGGGYSRWKDIAVTRWREDTTCDNWGTFCYIYDLDNNIFWSNTHQPALKQAKNYEATFTQGRADFRRSDNNIETHTEVVVSPEDDIEMRRIRITNRSRRRRSIEVTSYAEVVLVNPAADVIHPAFNNLFVQTELLPEQNAILCTRRPRSASEQTPWLCHILKAHGAPVESVSYETDRAKFIGRGNTVHRPRAMTETSELSNTAGFVLDPIVAIRYKITLEPRQTAVFDLITGVSDTREGCQALVDKYQERHLADRVLEIAWVHSQVLLRQINATEADAQLYGRMASSIVYHNPALRTRPTTISNNHKGQPGLWSYSISGDLPIVLLKVASASNISLVQQLLQAHTYWRLKGLMVDLVIWNEDHGGYRQTLQDLIMSLITAGAGANFTDKPGGIFLRPGDQVSQEDRTLIETVARVIISDQRGSLADQLGLRSSSKTIIPKLTPAQTFAKQDTAIAQPEGLLFFNGTGGFTPDGKEYVITTAHNKVTPAPWSNVLANANFGTVLSESGQAYTWIENAHEQRLTPWHNDPVCDSSGEVFYLRDEETGQVWSPALLPAPGESSYVTTHGFGYSVFSHIEDGIASEMAVFVDLADPVKFTSIKLRNESGRPRKITITGYVEWVLGDLQHRSIMHVVTETDTDTNGIFARNAYNADFAGKTAFFVVDDPNRTYTCDKVEFIGRNGTLRSPEAMTRVKLSNKVGAGLEPCTALQVVIELAEGQEREVVFRLGAGHSRQQASELIKRTRGLNAAHEALLRVKNFWNQRLNTIQIETPDAALNIMANGWLIYQALACRLWARSGYYQSGGGFGFRDQLQDVLALLYTDPAIARGQILLCASRQFREGDVQHWWHPPGGRGVRTRCSDDYLWLPFVTSIYVIHTGDTGLLDEHSRFLEGRQLNSDEESYYDLPYRSETGASIYDHCVAAIKNGLRMGKNGLPLMGSGDWNDGMDMVGREGKGESIWLAFFLYDILIKFSKIAGLREDHDFEKLCLDEAAKLKKNINDNAWDGMWYRRAYFDDGTPLGSASNDECSIDSISQSWAVISGAGDPRRVSTAMKSVNERLIDRENGIIQLLDPPFDKSKMNPGYIKGYVPGVRENGGQYSHAAIWMVMAFAAMGDSARTWELLNMINPVNHALTPADVGIYKVEPYVMVADVYKVPAHVGKGGWTWYTGSAGWMYQAIIQSLLGLKVEGTRLSVSPCMPPGWPSYKIMYRHLTSTYHITVSQEQEQGEMQLITDGKRQPGKFIQLEEDGREHTVEIILGAACDNKVQQPENDVLSPAK